MTDIDTMLKKATLLGGMVMVNFYDAMKASEVSSCCK